MPIKNEQASESMCINEDLWEVNLITSQDITL